MQDEKVNMVQKILLGFQTLFFRKNTLGKILQQEDKRVYQQTVVLNSECSKAIRAPRLWSY